MSFRLLLTTLVVGCISSAAAPPPEPLVLSGPSESTVGEPFALHVALPPQAPDGVGVILVLSLAGAGAGPCPPALAGTCLSLVEPVHIAGTNAASDALASFDFSMPPWAAGRTVSFQAIVRRPIGGVLSNVHQVESLPPVPTCTDECTTAGDVSCDDGSERVCGDHDGDPCLEWGAETSCHDGNVCTADVCLPGVGCGSEPASAVCSDTWTVFEQPVLVPTVSDADEGLDNVYAPDVMRIGGEWWMWYGAQGSDGHDRIMLAKSDDLVTWRKHPSWSNPVAVVPPGGANHVNDPSVVRHPDTGTFFMFYTEAAVGTDDQIALATSPNGEVFTRQGIVLDVGAPGAWDAHKVGRPSVLYEAGEFRMWFDGQINGIRHVGYATSPDGFTWTKYAGNPIVHGAGAIDVDRDSGLYVMVAEAVDGTLGWVGSDPVTWSTQGRIFPRSGQPYDAYGQVTPHLVVDEGALVAIMFGGASDGCWCHNRVGIAWPGSVPTSPGCDGCLGGVASCQEACELAGLGGGACGAPGSTDPAACCACDGGTLPQDCSLCLDGAATCEEACQGSGFDHGTCGNPGSTDPSDCCACTNDPAPQDCSQCLDGAATCAQACQGSGFDDGTCGNPGSTDPSACCACFDVPDCDGCLVGASTCTEACQGAGNSGGVCAVPGSTDPNACCACF